jgi:hypothetical protein
MNLLHDTFAREVSDVVRERVACQVSTIAKHVTSPSQLKDDDVIVAFLRRTIVQFFLSD